MNLPRGYGEEDVIYDTVPGVWYRVPVYEQAHLCHRSPTEDTIFWCGRTVWPGPDVIDRLDPPEWWVVEDRRKGSKCGFCREYDKNWVAVEAFHRARSDIGRPTRLEDDHLVVHPDALPRIAQWMMSED